MDLPNTRLWRDDPRPMASSPLIVVPTTTSVPPCSELSRCGLERPEYAARLGRRPTLTAPARAGFAILRVGAKKRDSKSNKETDRESKKERCCSEIRLTTKAPYKACSAFTRVTACTLALSPNS